MNLVTETLKPYSRVAWGETQWCFSKSTLSTINYMFAVRDDEFDAAVDSLTSAGFLDAPFSHARPRDPSALQSEFQKKIQAMRQKEYQNVNINSRRFDFPPGTNVSEKVVVFRSSYVHIPVPSGPQPGFVQEGPVFYPSPAKLLESMIKVILNEPAPGRWTSRLEAWAITYVYGLLDLPDDVLDSVSDEGVRDWFNKEICRFSGGLDRTTVTKRLGKVVSGSSVAPTALPNSDVARNTD